MTDRGDIFALSVRPEVRGIAWNNYSSSDDDIGMRWRSSSNLSITPERALQSTVVISCCRIISESIAGLPLSLYRKRENGSREIASELHLHKVLSFAPNNWQTKFEFVEQICMNLLLWGNSYSLIESGQHGAVESLHNLHPSRMRVERIENGRLRYTYTNPQSGRVEKYTQDAIMHIRWTPEPDGMRGMVPVEISRDAIALARSLEIHASKFWANAARPGTVLTHPGNLSSEAAEKLRDNWERAHMGSEKSYKTAVLTGGLQVTELGFTNEASQFVASRTFQTEEICRIYRLPLHLVQGTSSGSLEVQGQEFVTWTLAPWLERIQSAISRSLIYNDDLFVAGFDTRGLLRADSGSRASYYSTCTGLGILSINECRSMEGLPPLGEWQVLDIRYRAPRRDGSGKIVEDGTVTVWFNGKKVQDETRLGEPKSVFHPFRYGTTPYLEQIRDRQKKTMIGPVFLQDHGNPVKFRNVWVLPADECAFSYEAAGT